MNTRSRHTSSTFLLVPQSKAENRKKVLEQIASNRQLFENRKNESGRDPLEILTKELWNKVFHYLDNPRDLTVAWGTCRLFRDLLEERRLVCSVSTEPLWITWTLGNIHLELGSVPKFSNPSIRMSCVFKCLEKYQNLEKINLNLEHVEIKKEQDVHLRLPKLREFQLSHYQYRKTSLSSFERLIFTFSVSPFLLPDNSERLVWKMKNNLKPKNIISGLFLDINLKPGQVRIKQELQDLTKPKEIKIFNFEDLVVKKYKGRRGDTVPVVTLGRKKWWK